MRPDVTIVPERPAVVIEKRKPLSRAAVIWVVTQQRGLCGCGCRVQLMPFGEGVVDEHVVPLTLGGPNDLANRSLWRRPCSLAKTHGKRGDISRIAKAKRQAGETGNGKKRSIPKRAGPIQSPGFPKNMRRKMNGTTERITT